MKRLFALLLCAACLLSGCAGQNQIADTTGQNRQEESNELVFSTTDLEGNVWTEQNFAEYKLVMLNFWAPWCGPCVGEMPDLERLYQAYKDKGLLIVGVYGSDGMPDNPDIGTTIQSTGVTYPNLAYTGEFATMMSDYLPTTVFLDETGNLCGEQIIGAHSYAEWVQIIEALL